MKQKILSCLLALAMALTMLPTAALAADGAEEAPKDDGQTGTDGSGAEYVDIISVTGGKVYSSASYAEAGRNVYLSVRPDDGYVLDKLKVTDLRGWDVDVTWNKDKTECSFIMPNVQVSIEAKFSPAATEKQENNTPGGNHDSWPGGVGKGIFGLAASPFRFFDDVPVTAWYYDGVNFACQNALMQGVSGTDFDPEGDTTRGAVWTILARMRGRDTTGGDVWYERGQVWAMGQGITDGSNPEGAVTLQELITMLWRFRGSPYAPDGALDAFDAAGDVATYAKDAMNWACAYGLLSDMGGLALDPQASASRAQLATILMRVYNL